MYTLKIKNIKPFELKVMQNHDNSTVYYRIKVHSNNMSVYIFVKTSNRTGTPEQYWCTLSVCGLPLCTWVVKSPIVSLPLHIQTTQAETSAICQNLSGSSIPDITLL